MAEQTLPADEHVVINLKDPWLAAFLAWLWPGAGHLYQGRTAKGLLLMVAILTTFFFGFFMGGGKVVYASSTPFRWPYLCQVCVGAPALPALVEARRAKTNKEPLIDGWYAPPKFINGRNQLDDWLYDLNRYFEFGTVYTMIAGLLNVLAIYDAFGGPLYVAAKEPEEKKPPDKDPETKS